MAKYAFPETIPAFLYDPVTRIYQGECRGYLLPPFDKEEYYANENSVYVPLPRQPEAGFTFQLNALGTAWIKVEDWSKVPVFHKATSMRAPSPAPGFPLDPAYTAVVPPESTSTMWPRWNATKKRWVEGPNNAGKQWFNDKGDEGELIYPWDELPEGAQFGMAPSKRQAAMRAVQKALMAEAKDVVELCEELLNSPDATTGDKEQLVKAKAWRSSIILIDLDSDPTTFVEPPRPTITAHSGEPLGEK